MKNKFTLIRNLIIFFIILFGGMGFFFYRLNLALDNQQEINNFLLQVDNARNASKMNNKLMCGQIEDEAEDNARCIVEQRTSEQVASYLSILDANNQIATVLPSSQSRIGFSDGIYGENNFVEQYEIKGDFNTNTIYQYRLQFGSHVSSENLTNEQKETVEYYGGTLETSGKEYATILNPQASYPTLYQSGLADEYSRGLLIGTYPQDQSNQVMVSHLVAQEICSLDSSCDQIDDLLNQPTEVELTGILTDGTESKIMATLQISGVYLGQAGFNDIILAYDGLNKSDNKSSSDLSNQTLVDSYQQIAPELEENQAMVSSDSSNRESADSQESQEVNEKEKADDNYQKALQVVLNRSNQINDQFEQITAKNFNASTYGHHNSQTRTGFTDGIFGDTNFASQYNISGNIQENIVYRYYVDLKPLNKDNFTEEQISLIYQNSGDDQIVDGEYVAVLNPQASYETLKTAKLDDGYDNGLLLGSYPVAGSNQAMISYFFASNICDKQSDCSNISDLIDQNYSIELSGDDQAGNTQTIEATLSISGIYYGSTFFNDIILAYDGLNESEL